MKHFTVDSEIGGKELAECLQGYTIIIASVTPFSRKIFEHKDELLLISRHGIGYNNIDLDAQNSTRQLFPSSRFSRTRCRGGKQCHKFTSCFTANRGCRCRVKADQWEKRANFVGRTLFNKTVGVIGVGNTGSCVVETLRNGFRCDVLAYDPYKSATYLQSYGAKK